MTVVESALEPLASYSPTIFSRTASVVLAKGNDKGKVEGLVDYTRRNFFVPIREYDKVSRQCAGEGVGHPDFLLRLSELELIDRHHPMVDRRIKLAFVPHTQEPR